MLHPRKPPRKDIAEALGPFLADKLPHVRAFKMPDKPARTLKADLAGYWALS